MLDKANEVEAAISANLGSLAADAARESAGQLKDGAVGLYNQSCETARSAHGQAENYVREQPLKSILIAGAAGLALGWLLSRSCSSRNE